MPRKPWAPPVPTPHVPDNLNVLPVPKLPPPPPVVVERLAAAERVTKAWKVHDTVLVMSQGDRDLADRAFQNALNQKEIDHDD